MQNKVQENMPVNDPTQIYEDVIGENQQLLILHQTYRELTEGETKEGREEKLR